MVREISVFSIGDAKKASTWSGIPFFYIKELKRRGIVVHCINIAPNRYLRWIYNHLFLRYYRRRHPDTEYDYFRSRLNRMLTNIKVYYYQKRFNSSEMDLMLTYSVKTFCRREKVVFFRLDF